MLMMLFSFVTIALPKLLLPDNSWCNDFSSSLLLPFLVFHLLSLASRLPSLILLARLLVSTAHLFVPINAAKDVSYCNGSARGPDLEDSRKPSD